MWVSVFLLNKKKQQNHNLVNNSIASIKWFELRNRGTSTSDVVFTIFGFIKSIKRWKTNFKTANKIYWKRKKKSKAKHLFYNGFLWFILLRMVSLKSCNWITIVNACDDVCVFPFQPSAATFFISYSIINFRSWLWLKNAHTIFLRNRCDVPFLVTKKKHTHIKMWMIQIQFDKIQIHLLVWP